MKTKRVLAALLSLALLFGVCFAQPAIAAVFSFETQYDYDSADQAWLTDLVIKEDLNDVTAVTGTTLIAAPEYPYTETPASFKKDVDQFCELYAIDEETIRLSSLYFIELIGSNSSLFAAQATDAEVKAYLQNAGVAYPADPTTDEKTFAKALYTAMITGAFKDLPMEEGEGGVALEKALTSFIVSVSGFSEKELLDWIPGESLESLTDYVLAVGRLTLWSNGYDVTVDTPENEVYKLLSVLAIRNMGYSVDADASFSDLQSKYIAALLGKKYDVTVDPSSLALAMSTDSVAFYILQLIGQKNGLTVRMDNTSYEDAFAFVAEQTDVFDIEEGEFYADIYAYDMYLKAPRSSLWVYPTSYYGGVAPDSMRLTCNGILLQDNYFTQIAISEAEKVQELTITVKCSEGSGSEHKYVITVHSDPTAPVPETTESGSAPDDSKTILNSNAIVEGILTSIGVDPGIIDSTGNLIGMLPQSLQGVMNLISPSFNGESADAESSDVQTPSGNSLFPDAGSFISVLDSIGAIVNSVIGGIGGLDLPDNFTSSTFDFNFITFD